MIVNPEVVEYLRSERGVEVVEEVGYVEEKCPSDASGVDHGAGLVPEESARVSR